MTYQRADSIFRPTTKLHAGDPCPAWDKHVRRQRPDARRRCQADAQTHSEARQRLGGEVHAQADGRDRAVIKTTTPPSGATPAGSSNPPPSSTSPTASRARSGPSPLPRRRPTRRRQLRHRQRRHHS